MTRTIQELIAGVRDVEERATHHWQNDLAKFFPMSKGPTSTEISMFKSGAASQERIARALEVAVKELEQFKIGHSHAAEDLRLMGDTYGWCGVCSTKVNINECYASEGIEAIRAILESNE